MATYRAEDLVPGMVVRGGKGMIEIVRRLPDCRSKSGEMMLKFECTGASKTYTTRAGSLQYVAAVPSSYEKGKNK